MSDAGAISLIIFNVIRTSGPAVHWLSLQNKDRCHENSICNQAMQENWSLRSCVSNKGSFHCIK